MLDWLRKIWKNTKAEADYGKFIGMAIAIVIAIALVPTVYDTISGTNTTGWSSLTGGSGAVAIFELLLLIFIAGIVIYVVKQALS